MSGGEYNDTLIEEICCRQYDKDIVDDTLSRKGMYTVASYKV